MDGDTSTNDCVIAMASGLSGLSGILSLDSTEAQQFQACLDAVSAPHRSLIFPCMSVSSCIQMYFNVAKSYFITLAAYFLPVKGKMLTYSFHVGNARSCKIHCMGW